MALSALYYRICPNSERDGHGCLIMAQKQCFHRLNQTMSSSKQTQVAATLHNTTAPTGCDNSMFSQLELAYAAASPNITPIRQGQNRT
jgi:hypothetical protein